MKVFATVAVVILGLAAQQTLALESGLESEVPTQQSEALEARAVGCYQQGTKSKPAMCYKPNCPSDRRSVFWDFGCRDGSWKCCI
ncbi:hypothetical protein NUU61_002340 [Penicillium alfredii]|uniref:Uncharacterized protein n=1 Tax=Penicillium alfredii TaxID=1506179 RepID=A0A9W9FRF0_9EURO|nr:uncharacterized protein NUU61_002340 [Penicillium alfredii]KAJ5104993.1 hypothetical protein NUU61_002340 [Penicillium alfredii]